MVSAPKPDVFVHLQLQILEILDQKCQHYTSLYWSHLLWFGTRLYLTYTFKSKMKSNRL